MKISNIIQVFKTHSVTKRPVIETAQAPSSSAAKDTVKISDEAKALQKADAELQVARSALQEIPAGRENRIAEVKNRVSAGYYNSPDFISALSERLLQKPENAGSASAKPAAINNTIPGSQTQEVKAAKINQARERIQSGFYQDSTVTAKIADKILNTLGL